MRDTEQVDAAGADKYGHRGKGGVWSPYLGPCICEVCKEERAATRRPATPHEQCPSLPVHTEGTR